MDLTALLYYGLIFGIPLLALIWFGVSLTLFLRTPKENLERRKTRRILVICSGAVLCVTLGALLALMLLFAMAIRHM